MEFLICAIYGILFIFIIVMVITLTDKRRNYKSIDFKGKKLYLICKFLYGNCGLKTNKAVLSRNDDEFLVETEDNEGRVESFKFNKNQIVDITIKEELGSKMGTSLYNAHESSTRLGHDNNFVEVPTMKFKKQYNINIMLQNDIHLRIISEISPYHIFD